MQGACITLKVGTIYAEDDDGESIERDLYAEVYAKETYLYYENDEEIFILGIIDTTNIKAMYSVCRLMEVEDDDIINQKKTFDFNQN